MNSCDVEGGKKTGNTNRTQYNIFIHHIRERERERTQTQFLFLFYKDCSSERERANGQSFVRGCFIPF